MRKICANIVNCFDSLANRLTFCLSGGYAQVIYVGNLNDILNAIKKLATFINFSIKIGE